MAKFLYFFLFLGSFTCASTTAENTLALSFEKHVQALAALPPMLLISYSIPLHFSVKKIRDLVFEIQKQKKIRIIFSFWKERQQDILSDNIYKREFSALLVALYQNIFIAHQDKHIKSNQRFLLFDLVSVYTKLASLPIPELLSLLDRCLIAYKEILLCYNFPYQHPAQITSWLAENWWLPTIFLITTWWSIHTWKKTKKKAASYYLPAPLLLTNHTNNSLCCFFKKMLGS